MIGKKPRRRRDGASNKITGSAQVVIAEVAERLGGVDELIAWMKESEENETTFWTTIFTRLIDNSDDDEPKKIRHFFVCDRSLSPEEWEKILRAEGIER
jgi:hypothetical protein